MPAAESVRDGLPPLDLWRVCVQAHAAAMDDYWGLLDENERQRAARVRHDGDRRRQVIARATLRRLIGPRLQIDPARLSFGRGEFGKPWVPGAGGLHFNSSHSGDWILHGLSASVPLGVDVEAIPGAGFELGRYAQVLAPAEFERLAALDAGERARAFVQTWVCKEAYVKALGHGLTHDLRAICIGPGAGAGPVLLDDAEGGQPCGDWSFRMIDVGPAHAACVAHAGPPQALRVHDLPPRPFDAAGRCRDRGESGRDAGAF